MAISYFSKKVLIYYQKLTMSSISIITIFGFVEYPDPYARLSMELTTSRTRIFPLVIVNTPRA